MKYRFTFFLFWTLSSVFAQLNFHSFRVANIFGDTINLSSFAGKKLMVVNTASFCGYTHQFSKLQKLDSIYQPYNFRVIGFPCNDFGGQDPFSDSTINSFCLNQYGITFPMMSKISIRVGDTSIVYKWLQRQSLNGVANATVNWNFNKFLIDENGNWKRHLLSPVDPLDTTITNWITQGVTGVKSKMNPLDGIIISGGVDGNFSIQFPQKADRQISLEVLDLNGRQILFQNFARAEQELPIHIHNKGVYIFRISMDGHSLNKKLISY